MTTPKENREAWVKALRSGDYEQGQGKLHQNDRWCCLGVACDLAFKAGVLSQPIVSRMGIFRYDGDDNYLPTVVQAWLGVTMHAVKTEGGSCLAARNDEGATFAEIADLIESGQVLTTDADS